MAKAERLMQVLHLLRILPAPISAQDLATDLNVTLRTIYRDIEALRASGAVIDGAAGYGYTMIEDPALPPMMFTVDEVEALVLGLKEVQEVGDPVLAIAAGDAMGKLRATLPTRLENVFEHSVLHSKRFRPRPTISIDVGALRQAAREENEVSIEYADSSGTQSTRVVRPLGIVLMDNVLVLMAWCCLRADYRAFRLDRMIELEVQIASFRPHRVPMLREFKAKMDREAVKRIE